MEAIMQADLRRKEKEREKERLMAQAEVAAAAESKKKAADKKTDYWLAAGIIVKVVNKKMLDGKYYKVKGVVEKLVDKYTGHVRMNSDGTLIKLDSDDLETVVPQVGSTVLLVNGRCRGETAELLSINQDKFCVSVKIDGGEQRGRVLEGVEYEDVCKMA